MISMRNPRSIRSVGGIAVVAPVFVATAAGIPWTGTVALAAQPNEVTKGGPS
jgi:hypothetical protein